MEEEELKYILSKFDLHLEYGQEPRKNKRGGLRLGHRK